MRTSQIILAIDDSEEIHHLLDGRLRSEGLVIHHAMCADEGLRKARELQPDLVLLDVDMPGMSGYEVCQKLKSDPATVGLQIIFLTAVSSAHDKVRALDLGATDYVTKPFEPAELRARVRAALRTKRYQDLLAARAHLDGLTGLWNRAWFDRRIAEEVAASLRYGRVVSVVMMDLDHFSRVNETHGHPMGDEVLLGVAEALGACLRTTDATCRYGGEEFAIILAETGAAGAIVAGERIQAALARLCFSHRGARFGVTASLGTASSELFEDATRLTAAALVGAADEALFIAKRSGRDRLCHARPWAARRAG